MNLLKTTPLGPISRSRYFPLIPQCLMLAAFILIIIGGWNISTPDSALAKTLRNTNLSNLLVWSYWWPLIIISAIFVGRIWCTVCPMELVSFLASKVGLKRSVPAFFKSGWLVTIFYIIILFFGIKMLAIHRQPHHMAIYMLMLLGVALVSGLIYKKRAFCSYICPVGHLLGLYSFLAPFQWRAANKKTCADCHTRDCVDTQKQERLTGRSCTSNLFPSTIEYNQDCLMCTQCAKVCPNDNLSLSPCRPFADLFTNLNLNTAQLVFVLVLSGFVVYEILSEWSTTKTLIMWMPKTISAALSVTKPWDGLISALVMFFLYPAVLFGLVGLGSKFVSKSTARSIWGGLGLLLLPTMAAAHILKGCLKMTSRIPYWEHLSQDLSGVTTANAIFNGSLSLNKSLPTAMQPGLTGLAVILLTIALIASLLMLRRSPALSSIDRGGKTVLAIGTVLYWAVFAVTIVAWRF